jgi:Site-specific DNA methylase
MMNLANIGKSSKRKRENLAGQYGEGFKSGVKVATSYGFKVDVMDQSEKLDFRIVREKKSFQYKLSNLYKEKIPKQMKKQCKDEPSFVTVRMKLKDPRDLDQIKNNLFFRPRSFRLLTPGINTQINEEKGDFHILKNEENRGEIYCMGIFVQKKPNLLFGYDININVKGLISGRDRNTIVHEIFLECVAESLLQTSSRPLLVELLDLWITLKEGDLRKNIEFQASFDYEDLATLLSQRYQEKKGVETYPCKEEDVKRLQEVFKDPKLDVLESSFVDLLRFGIYRSVNNEIDFFYSEENQYKSISKDEEDILQSALFRLDHVEANRVLYEKIVVVDGTLLTKKLLCKKRDDVIYVNSKAFCSDEKDSPQKLSFQLGYHIAQSADEYGSFGCKYADIQSSSQEWYTFRVTSADFDFTRNLFEVVCCEKLIQRKPILQCLECEDDGDAATSRLISCVELKDKESNIFIKTKPGYKYTFQAVDLSCPVYQSVSQWLDFRFENKFLMNMLEIRDPLTLKFCRELIEIPIEQVVQDEGHVTINEDGDGKNRDSGEVEGSSIQEDGGACDITECIPGMILEQNTNDSVEYGINDLELNSDEEDLDASDSEIESFFCGNDGDDSSYTDNDDDSSNESVDEETDIPKAKRQKLTKTYYGKELRKGEVYRHSSYKCVKVQDHESPPSFTVICTLQQSLHKAIPLEPPCHILLEADACVAFPEKLVRFEIQTRKKEFIEGLQYKLTEDEYQEEISDVQYEFSSSEKDTKVDGFFIEWRLQLLETQESFCCQKVPRELVLYAGVGGASIGDHEAGFDVKWLVEKDHLCAASLKSDDWHKNASVYCEDVSIFLEKCEKHEMGYPGPKEVDHIQSLPPCQPWSAANRNAEVGKDTRNKMELLSLCRAVGHFRPKTAVLEQVTGIFRKVHEGRQYLSDLVVNFLSLGYQVRLAVHDSKMFGVPQCRKRLIITLARNDTELPSLPLPTDQLSLHVALKSLKNIKTDSEGSGIVMCGQERTFNHILATEKDTEKVYIDEKCKFVNTIKRNTNLWWSDKDRPFSLRELAGLFSFPLTKQFFGEIQQIRKQLGNAVPLKVAEAIAKEVIKVHHHDNFA